MRILGTKRPEPEGSGQHDRNTIGHWAFAILATAGDLGLSVASALFGVYLLSGFTESVFSALACFGDLPDEERQILFETFQVWQDTDASVGVAA